MCRLILVFLTTSHLIANQTNETRNNLLFEKLYSQNKRLWSFISEAQKSENQQTRIIAKPDDLRVEQPVKSIGQKKVDDWETVAKVSGNSGKKNPTNPNIADYLSKDPADGDLELESTPEFGQLLRTKGLKTQSDNVDQNIYVPTRRKRKSFHRENEPQGNDKKLKPKYLETESSSRAEAVEKDNGPNALQKAWNSVVRAAKSVGQPKSLNKGSKRRNFKVWSFQIGLRNLVNNDSDGFKHDAEIYHQLGYRLNDRQKLFAEYKSVTMTGDGFGKVSRTGVGYQHYLKSVNEVGSFYPYFAFFYDHWVGNFESFKGVSLLDGKDSKSVFTTRLGVEYPLTDTTNLDLYWERGKKFLSFTDSLGNEIEVHSRSNLYGMGLSHAF